MGRPPNVADPPPLLDRIRSWWFLAILAGWVLLGLVLSLLAPDSVGRGFFERYFWAPIRDDGGYNVFNTLGLLVVFACLLGWFYRILAEYGQRMDAGIILACIPYFLWGVVFRVLEDADLFAPFAEDIRASAASNPAGASCVAQVGGSFLHQCFGVFFITPIVWVEIALLLFVFGRLGYEAELVSRGRGVRHGLAFFGASLLGLLSLYVSLWAAGPNFVRFLLHPAWLVAPASIAYAAVHADARRQGHVRWRWCFFAYSLPFLFLALFYLATWMSGGVSEWGPTRGTQGWILAAALVGPALVAVSIRSKARLLSGQGAPGRSIGRRAQSPGRGVGLLAYLVILEAFAVVASLVAIHDLWQGMGLRPLGWLLAGPAAVAGGSWLTHRLAAGRFGVHPLLNVFANPYNLFVVGSQILDGFMTSLGLDLLGAREKHVFPRTLIGWVEGLGLPEPAASFPATLVMVPLKIGLALAAVWVTDVTARDLFRGRHNLAQLVKMGVIVVGFAPGARDAVRVAMGV